MSGMISDKVESEASYHLSTRYCFHFAVWDFLHLVLILEYPLVLCAG